MALDARSRSSIHQELVPVLGEHDANVLMSELPSPEVDELRQDLHVLEIRMTVRLGAAIAASTTLDLAAISLLG